MANGLVPDYLKCLFTPRIQLILQEEKPMHLGKLRLKRTVDLSSHLVYENGTALITDSYLRIIQAQY